MIHELTDSERKTLIAAMKEVGFAYILWYGNEVKVRRRQIIQLIREKKYAAYGMNSETGIYTFYALSDTEVEIPHG